jgi:hypothetical protein
MHVPPPGSCAGSIDSIAHGRVRLTKALSSSAYGQCVRILLCAVDRCNRLFCYGVLHSLPYSHHPRNILDSDVTGCHTFAQPAESYTTSQIRRTDKAMCRANLVECLHEAHAGLPERRAAHGRRSGCWTRNEDGSLTWMHSRREGTCSDRAPNRFTLSRERPIIGLSGRAGGVGPPAFSYMQDAGARNACQTI